MEGVCRVGLLGGFRVDVAGRRIPDIAWRHRRGADLVKILALAAGHRLQREQVMDMLWPEFPAEAAGANLRKATYFARQALGGETAIGVQAGTVSLWPAGELVVDVDEFERAPAIELYPGELLPEDRYAEWTEPRRERLRERFLELLRRSGRWEQVLVVDRADEEAHRAIMRAHLERGNRTGAIRQFDRLREVLRVDLGVGPGPDTVALFEQALEAGPEPPTIAQQAQALIARGLVRWNLQDLDAAEGFARAARSAALEQGLSRELGEASTLLGMVAFARGTWRQVFRADFLDTLDRAPERAQAVFNGQLCLAEGSLNSLEAEATMGLVRELLPVAERARNRPGEALLRLLLGAIELFHGQVDEAQAHFSRSLALYEEVGSGSGQAVALIRLAGVAVAAGRPEEASRLLERAWPLADHSELGPHYRVQVFEGRVRSAAGLERQLAVVEEGERTLVRSQVCGPCSIGWCVASAIAFARGQEIAKSRKCLKEAERLTGMWQGGPWQAATWEARAHLRLAEGDPEQARALMLEAARLFADSGRELDAARCRSSLVSPAGTMG